MMESLTVRQEVWFWENKLGVLALKVPPEEPPKRVWERIEQRLWPETTEKSSKRGAFGWLWPSVSALASAAVLVLAVMLVQERQPGPETGALLSGAVVQQDTKDPLWLVSESGDTNQLRLRPVAATAPDADKDYELWVLPATEGGSPLSLGVIPVDQDTLQLNLTPETRAALKASKKLAISLEPEGGSTTGAPTGPILHVTELHEM
jgi:anti-sigma-K factor RskA